MFQDLKMNISEFACHTNHPTIILYERVVDFYIMEKESVFKLSQHKKLSPNLFVFSSSFLSTKFLSMILDNC